MKKIARLIVLTAIFFVQVNALRAQAIVTYCAPSYTNDVSDDSVSQYVQGSMALEVWLRLDSLHTVDSLFLDLSDSLGNISYTTPVNIEMIQGTPMHDMGQQQYAFIGSPHSFKIIFPVAQQQLMLFLKVRSLDISGNIQTVFYHNISN